MKEDKDMFKKSNLSMEEMELEAIFKEMQCWDKTDEEYGRLLSRWIELRKAIGESKSKSRIKPDTWVTIASNLAIVLAVLNFERLNNISTKALSFIKKI